MMRKAFLCTLGLVAAAAVANAAPVTLDSPTFDNVRKTYAPSYPGTVSFVSMTLTAGGYYAAPFADGGYLDGAGYASTWSDSSVLTSGTNASLHFGPGGWVGTGAANTVGYEALGTNYMALKPSALAPDFAGYTTGASVASQLTGETIQANTKYTLSYLLGSRNATPPAQAGYLAGTAGNLTADAASNPAPAAKGWATQTFVFDTSNAANSPLVGQALTVGFSGGAGTDILFDNVTLDASPIPEPTGMAAIALAGLATLRRRRQA